MNKKIVKKIITVIAVASTCTLIGCSKNVNSNDSSLPNSEPVVQNSEASSQASATATSETDTSAEIQTDTGTEVSLDKNNSDKQQMIDLLKKQAEEDADKDRINIIEALGDKKSDGRWGDAIGFIKVNYPDYYSTDELLQNGMKYGYYLAFLYKDYKGADNGYGQYYEMGALVSETAQSIYLGTDTPTDNFTTEQLQALEKLLKSSYGKYYGSQSGDS